MFDERYKKRFTLSTAERNRRITEMLLQGNTVEEVSQMYACSHATIYYAYRQVCAGLLETATRDERAQAPELGKRLNQLRKHKEFWLKLLRRTEGYKGQERRTRRTSLPVKPSLFRNDDLVVFEKIVRGRMTSAVAKEHDYSVESIVAIVARMAGVIAQNIPMHELQLNRHLWLEWAQRLRDTHDLEENPKTLNDISSP